MCTVVVLIRPDRVLLAANRDERIDRPWDPPAEHWPGILGGRDRSAGGTWMAMNRSGVVAAILNRPGTLGPAAGKRSRGVLPLTALRHDSASAAAAAITALDAGEWRGFNMVIVDAKGGYFIRGLAAGQPEMQPLGLGVSMVTAHDPNEMENPRTARHLARFQAVDPSPDDWSPWLEILSDRAGPRAAQINVVPSGGFGTVCASLVSWVGQQHPVWLFADGPPDEAPFRTVDLPASWG